MHEQVNEQAGVCQQDVHLPGAEVNFPEQDSKAERTLTSQFPPPKVPDDPDVWSPNVNILSSPF